METQLFTYLFGAGVLAIALVAIFRATFFTVQQRTVAIVQRLGKFMREAGPGIQVKIPFIDRVVGRVNLRVQQLDVEIETKTEDNVFVRMVVAVQYYVLPEKVYDAFYKLDNAHRQITSFVFDVVRAQVPKIKLDDVFEKKDDIANIVKSELAQVMEGFGYGILKALVTDIDPDAKVKESMNEINAAQRMRVAATERGEADRILKVKSAEGDAQSKALQGRGIADSRPTASHRRRPARFGGRVPQVRARYDGQGRDEPGADDPVLRHAQGDWRIVANQRDPDPTLSRESQHPHRADAQRHDGGRPDGQSVGSGGGGSFDGR
jgi:regulator of protease activity HflC (stomatin/prohibitin superfamily)